jgi:initiation factor 1A
MVRQTKGGRNNRKVGRKYVGTPGGGSKLRVIEEEGELYAAVKKILGGGMMNVGCIDGVERLCVMRKKFRGRGKRDNMVGKGSWVLVGLREWESSSRNKCDLIEVYNPNEITKLQTLDGNWSVLKAVVAGEGDAEGNDDNIQFVDDKTAEYIKLLEQGAEAGGAEAGGAEQSVSGGQPSATTGAGGGEAPKTVAWAEEEADDDDIDFDDI